MADPELKACPGPSPLASSPACQASSVIKAWSPQLLTVPALLRQQLPNEPASPAPSATGRGKLSQRVRGSPDDAALAPQTLCPGRNLSEIPGVLPAYFPSHPPTATRRLDSWLSSPKPDPDGLLLSHLRVAKKSWKSSKGSLLGNQGAWQRQGGRTRKSPGVETGC